MQREDYGSQLCLFVSYYIISKVVCLDIESKVTTKCKLHVLSNNYRIAGIFRGGKFSRKPLQLYYSNYSRAEFSRNAPSSAKN